MPTTLPPYRYYAFTFSVGLIFDSVPRTVEIQEIQPLVEAPDPATAVTAVLYGRGFLDPGTGWATNTDGPPGRNVLVYGHASSRTPHERHTSFRPDVHPARIGTLPDVGYAEVWDTFKVRSAFHQGQVWSVASFPTHGWW